MGFQGSAGISSAPPAPPPPAPSLQGPSKMSDRTYRRFLRDERVIEDLRDKFDAFKASALLQELSKSRSSETVERPAFPQMVDFRNVHWNAHHSELHQHSLRMFATLDYVQQREARPDRNYDMIFTYSPRGVHPSSICFLIGFFFVCAAACWSTRSSRKSWERWC